MNRELYSKSKWLVTGSTIGLCCAGYLAWCVWTISYRGAGIKGMALFVSVGTIIGLDCLMLRIKKDVKLTSYGRQWCAIYILVVILGSLLLLKSGRVLWSSKKPQELLTLIGWVAGGIVGMVILRKDIPIICKKMKEIVINQWHFLIFLLITAVLCVDRNVFQYRWDGLLYYLTCRDLSLDSLSSLAIYGHIAQTYGAMVQVGNVIFGDTKVAMLLVNVGLLFIGITYFYKLLQSYIPHKKQIFYIIFTMVYAWSPFLLGMVHYYSLDFGCQCLFPPVLYYLKKKKWVFFELFSLLFCFTKEPAIIVYGMVCVGAVIEDMLKDDDCSFGAKVLHCFRRGQYYIMVLPGIFWLVTYKMLGPWSAGEGGISLDIAYIGKKCKNLYLLNFNWIFTLMLLCSIILIIKQKKYYVFKEVLSLLLAQIGFTMFSCVFKTVNHARYNDTNQITLYLLTLIMLSIFITKEMVVEVTGSIVAVLMLVSCFWTIDPVTYMIYPRYKVGAATLISTSASPLGDGMIYNRQMLGMEKALDLAMEDVVGSDTMICFPAIDNNAYSFDGMSEVGELQNYRLDTEYWDANRMCRIPEETENSVAFQVCQMTENMDWVMWEKETLGEISFFYLDNVGKNYYNILKEKYNLLEEKAYSADGWTIHKAAFQVQ